MQPADAARLQPTDAKMGSTDGPAAEAALEPELQAHIGRQLRAMYNEVVNEPIPDRLLQLLQELERKQAGTS